MIMNQNITIPETSLRNFCKENGIHRLMLFGSVLRDDFTDQSDVDILVGFDSKRLAGSIRLAKMEFDLSTLFGGRKVDINTVESLSPYLREHVLKTAQTRFVESTSK